MKPSVNKDLEFLKIFAHLKNLRKIAKKEFSLKKKDLKISVHFNLNSISVLGMFRIQKGEESFRFNRKIIIEAGEDKYLDVVTHEFAHLVVYRLYGRTVESHGPEWESVMKKLGADDASRYNTSLSDAMKEAYKDQLMEIKCKCSNVVYSVGIRRGNNILNRKSICVNCNSKFRKT